MQKILNDKKCPNNTGGHERKSSKAGGYERVPKDLSMP
jgi:hypothetical protein